MPENEKDAWGAWTEDALSAWRDNREGRWFKDLGYEFQDVLNAHRYGYERTATKPDDPGWHACTCGWEGYWSAFHNHVANHLRARVIPPGGTS